MGVLNRAIQKIKFMVTTSHKIGRVTDFKTFCIEKQDACRYNIIEMNRHSEVCQANYWGSSVNAAFKTSLPDSYYVEMYNGSIIGASNVVLSSKNVILYDMLALRRQYHANMTDNGLCMLGGVPMHFGERFIFNYYSGKRNFIDSGISLAANMSNNYYHFMFEVAAKLYLLSKVNIDKNIPLLIDEAVLKIPQMVEILTKLNESKRKIVSIKSYVRYTVKKLIVLSKPNVIVPNLKKGALDRVENYAFDSKTLCWIKKKMLENSTVPIQKKWFKRIFLTRRSLNKRTCNEAELEPILRKYGFVFVDTGSLSVVEQVLLFSHAEIIAGSSGAAFTNLMFCKRGTKAIIFMPVKSPLSCFSSLASAVGVSAIYFSDNNSNQTIHQKSFSINPTELDKYLASIEK